MLNARCSPTVLQVSGATVSHMESIGVRELRRDASRWLARVRAGETFVVTDRGNPVAELGPVHARSGYAAMVADGRIVVGTGRALEQVLGDLDREHPEDTSEPPLSWALAELRADER